MSGLLHVVIVVGVVPIDDYIVAVFVQGLPPVEHLQQNLGRGGIEVIQLQVDLGLGAWILAVLLYPVDDGLVEGRHVRRERLACKFANTRVGIHVNARGVNRLF